MIQKPKGGRSNSIVLREQNLLGHKSFEVLANHEHVGEMEFVEGSERIKTPDILLSQFIEAAVISMDKKKRKGKQVVEVEVASPERGLSLTFVL